MGQAANNVGKLGENVTQVLNEIREGMGVSISALALSCDISQPTLHRLLNAQRPMYLEQFYQICEALKVKPTAILEDAESRLAVQNTETPSLVSHLPIPPQPTQEELETLLAEADIAAAARDIPKGLENLNEDWTRQDLDWEE